MARIRTIKPEFWKHEDLSALPEITHMLAAALLNHADDEGYFNANPALVKAECLPLREYSLSTQEMLNQLSNVGYIELGAGADGKRYGRVVKFDEHQRVNRPTASKIKVIHIVWGDGLSTHGALSEDSSPERKGKEGKGKEQGREPTGVGLSTGGGDAAPDDHADDEGEEGQHLLGNRPKKPAVPNCPHMEIIDLYHEVLPELAQVRVWEEDRKELLRARWKGAPERQSLDWWREFFTSVRDMPFLMGERTGRDDRAFACTLEWLVRPKNFAKVLEGNYLELRR
ncbi:hypothetical protein [Stenotrophomonas sp. BIGb0135]|uniref:hypothetical protein n=1 Tax=Stenotrophomonas sp. BIGb0135 TaxID=2940620 RepID=UPI002168C2FB|nr:hypothetical protein [Stenotrophomonas sp. BIGb0135]MCS4234440.1 hypothetical protein [Stenotrophomonas sp. BIGb0135]